MAIETYQPQLPLDIDDNSRFNMISETLSNVKQKLKMIVLTSPGEKIMDPQFGVGIYRYLFEPSTGIVTVDNKQITLQNLEKTLFNSISTQVYKYASDITINNITVTVEDTLLNVLLEYTYRSFANDNLLITINP